MKNDYKIVVLNCPYINWDSKEVREVFSEMVHLKFENYQKKHFFGILPVDSSDFIGDHLLIYKKDQSGHLKLVNGVKTLPYDRCNLFNYKFTPITLLENDNQHEYLDVLNEIIQQGLGLNRKMSYYSSWTMKSGIEEKASRERIKELFSATTYLYHRERGIKELLGFGVPKLRTDELFKSWGYKRVHSQGVEIPAIPASFLGGLDSVLIHLESFSSEIKELSLIHKVTWDSRLEIGSAFDEFKTSKKFQESIFAS